MSISGVTIAPIERFLAAMSGARRERFADHHVSPPLVRVDGQLIPIPDEPSLDQDTVEHLVLGVLSEDLKQELRANREVDFSFSYNNVARSAPTATTRWVRSRCRCA